MKAKTIRAIISKKFKEFVASIEDEAVAKAVEKNSIITGGCIASMLLNEKVNDYDIYFKDRATALLVAKYYVKKFLETTDSPKFKKDAGVGPVCEMWVDDTDDRVRIMVKSAGIASEEGDEEYQYFEGLDDPDAMDATEYVETAMNAAEDEDSEKPRYRPVFMSRNAITLSQGVQIVLRFFGKPDEIHENYDFVHCTNYWTSWDGILELKPDALECLLTKELRYVGSKYPICSIVRLRKFIKRGFTINAGNILKICMQVSDLDLTNVEVLEEQLTGVDVAYFHEVIQKLKEKDKEQVDATYLMEIIDRMF